MILFFDTETTGFYDDRLPPGHDAQPHIVHLAAELCDDEGAPVAGFSLIVDPGAGIPIPKGASDVHGITRERADQFGISRRFALIAFGHLYQRCDLLVAHNIKFDKGLIETAMSREYGPRSIDKPLFCTMEAATPVVNLPPTARMLAADFDKPKPPKLEECIRHFFDEALEGAHDAMIDVAACRRVYFHLKTLETQ